MDVIKLQHVSKSFGLGGGLTTALCDVSLTVPKGEFLILMGPSGSGKSSLLNIIGLLDRVDEGSYSLSGFDVAHLSGRRKARIRRNQIGFIFQNFNLIGRMNIIDNVCLPLTYKGLPLVKRYKRASDILTYLGIQEKEYYLPHQLSGGQLQRAAIARAMVNRPSIVLADEPTGNLDTKSAQLIMAALSEIHKAGNTIIMVTHNPELAQYADRVIKMEDGRIEQELTGAAKDREIASDMQQASQVVEAASPKQLSVHHERSAKTVADKTAKPTSPAANPASSPAKIITVQQATISETTPRKSTRRRKPTTTKTARPTSAKPRSSTKKGKV